jgi:alpha-D-xyloside xylohydrolase
MLGESLLVAPVFGYDGAVTYYVPAGRWTNFLTGTVVEGPGWKEETHDMLSLPLLVRPNSVIAVGKTSERPDYEYANGVTLQVYELADGQEVNTVVPDLAGEAAATWTVRREGPTIAVTRHGAAAPWQLLLINVHAIDEVNGGTYTPSAQGVLVTPAPDVDTLYIRLDTRD